VLRQPAPGLGNCLRRLIAPGEAAGRLAEAVGAAGGADLLARWHFLLAQLSQRGLLHLSVDAEGERLATLVPMAPGFALAAAASISTRPLLLSRFAFVRRAGDALTLESPLACARIVLHDARVLALLHALGRASSAAQLSRQVLGLAADVVTSLLGLLSRAGVVSEVLGDAAAEEAPPLGCWEFHDLLFHTRSREGRHDAPFGAVCPLAGKLDPPPALKSARVPAGEGIDLYRPNLEQLLQDDPPFARVQEERQSVREYADGPIDVGQLGEFLYRVARVKAWEEGEVATPEGPRPMTFVLRPYPAGGALYELEVYVAVQACRGLMPGLFWYDPSAHRLERIKGSEVVQPLLWDAARAAGIRPERLQVLLILASRLPRLAWKYASLAYALTLKHVGVVFQTMYLAATAMGLAPCAVGGGNSDLFARVAGLDYYAETSMGEFLLGSKRTQA
jgi:SagB-type dehydrogenase family enzyme